MYSSLFREGERRGAGRGRRQGQQHEDLPVLVLDPLLVLAPGLVLGKTHISLVHLG
jgi:hypothetical protein